VTVEWRNELEGPFPVVDTVAPQPTDSDGMPVQCVPGLSGGEPNRETAELIGYTVVHLHGGLTPASFDGWAENLFAPGQPAVFHYPMDQRAALLWYHDHVMGITKLDVYAGLAGLWIVRDERERELELPEGPPFEIPLLIQDRNFDVDEHGLLTGRLVHKTDPEVMEAFPPFTVVNGKVWPVLEIRPATYRFRVLNGSNARYVTALPSSSGSGRSGPTTGSSVPRRPFRRTDSCSPRPSAPTCSWTSPTSHREPS
jgi:FtsP/CotA-like multicopper oxidase with cupredoxin domain